ncbi:MAG: hypothetical protein ACD_45C00195G0002, partial [uncultured bacterium]
RHVSQRISHVLDERFKDEKYLKDLRDLRAKNIDALTKNGIFRDQSKVASMLLVESGAQLMSVTDLKACGSDPRMRVVDGFTVNDLVMMLPELDNAFVVHDGKISIIPPSRFNEATSLVFAERLFVNMLDAVCWISGDGETPAHVCPVIRNADGEIEDIINLALMSESATCVDQTALFLQHFASLSSDLSKDERIREAKIFAEDPENIRMFRGQFMRWQTNELLQNPELVEAVAESMARVGSRDFMKHPTPMRDAVSVFNNTIKLVDAVSEASNEGKFLCLSAKMLMELNMQMAKQVDVGHQSSTDAFKKAVVATLKETIGKEGIGKLIKKHFVTTLLIPELRAAKIILQILEPLAKEVLCQIDRRSSVNKLLALPAASIIASKMALDSIDQLGVFICDKAIQATCKTFDDLSKMHADLSQKDVNEFVSKIDIHALVTQTLYPDGDFPQSMLDFESSLMLAFNDASQSVQFIVSSDNARVAKPDASNVSQAQSSKGDTSVGTSGTTLTFGPSTENVYVSSSEATATTNTKTKVSTWIPEMHGGVSITEAGLGAAFITVPLLTPLGWAALLGFAGYSLWSSRSEARYIEKKSAAIYAEQEQLINEIMTTGGIKHQGKIIPITSEIGSDPRVSALTQNVAIERANAHLNHVHAMRSVGKAEDGARAHCPTTRLRNNYISQNFFGGKREYRQAEARANTHRNRADDALKTLQDTVNEVLSEKAVYRNGVR